MTLWSYLLQRPLVEELGPSTRRAARHAYQHDLTLALLSAGMFHLLLILTVFLLASRFAKPEIEPPPFNGGLPIQINNFIGKGEPPAPSPPRFQPPRLRPPTQGVFVPVPENAQPDTTEVPLPSTTFVDTSIETGPGGEGAGGPGGVRGGDGDGQGGDDGPGAWGDGYPEPGQRVIVEIQPRLIEQPMPDYPEIARMARIEGKVLVHVLVGKDGRVKKAMVIQQAHPSLDEAALEAAKRALFKPAIQQGQPVPVWVSIPFRFKLH